MEEEEIAEAVTKKLLPPAFGVQYIQDSKGKITKWFFPLDVPLGGTRIQVAKPEAIKKYLDDYPR